MDNNCTHKKDDQMMRDVAIFVAVILGLFVVREIFCWFLKSNHIFSTLKQNRERLIHVEKMLKSLTH